MTRPGCHPIDPDVERMAARLIQLHQDTRPRRIGKLLKLTPSDVRKIWGRTQPQDMANLAEALSVLRPAKRTVQRPAMGATS